MTSTIIERTKQCNKDGSFFVSAGSHIIEFPIGEICRVINTGVESMGKIGELNNVEMGIYQNLNNLSIFTDVKRKYHMEVEPEYNPEEALARIRDYVKSVSGCEMKIVEDSGNLMKIYQGDYIAEISSLGELILDYTDKLKKLHDTLDDFSLEAIKEDVNGKKEEFEKSFKGIRNKFPGNLRIKIRALNGIISNFYENISAFIRLSMLNGELRGISNELSANQLNFDREIPIKVSIKLRNELKLSIENVIKLADEFIDYIMSDFLAKSDQYEDIRGRLISCTNTAKLGEEKISDMLEPITKYLERSVLKLLLDEILGDPELKEIKHKLSEQVGTLKRKSLKRSKKEMVYVHGIFDIVSSSLKEVSELFSPYEHVEEGRATYKGLLKEIVDAIKDFSNVKGYSNLIRKRIVLSEKLKGYLLMQKLLGQDIMQLADSPYTIDNEDQDHITVMRVRIRD